MTNSYNNFELRKLTNLSEPIPPNAGDVMGWQEVPIVESNEPMVALGPFSPYREILTSSVYFGESSSSPYKNDEIEGSLITVFVRQSAADRLLAAQALLPINHYLMVYDAYRPVKVQGALYQQYLSELGRIRPELSPNELAEEVQKYVSLPSSEPTHPSTHSTGGSIDLCIIKIREEDARRVLEINRALSVFPYDSDDGYELEMEKLAILRSGEMLDFGTEFDDGTERAALARFEYLEHNELAKNNRRLLYTVMTQVGFRPYKHEWWHFNAPETQMGAIDAGLPQATYGQATLSVENRVHENMRREHYRGVNLITDFLKLANSKLGDQTTSELKRISPGARTLLWVIATQIALGSYRDTNLRPAQKITPVLE